MAIKNKLYWYIISRFVNTKKIYIKRTGSDVIFIPLVTSCGRNLDNSLLPKIKGAVHDGFDFTEGVFLPTNYQQFFIKNNKIKGFSGFFKFIFLNPKRFSLVHEFNNLIFLSGRGVTPIPIALGLRVGFLYITEVLIVSRFVNCITVDEYIKNSPEDCLKVLDLVSDLFLFSWSMRFTHLDPHPNNIIFNGGKLLFVDLEGVKLNSDNLELHFGFLFGRFFSYWFNRYIDEEKYDDYVIRILNDQIPSLDLPVYLHYYTEFKSKHFSRTEHENMFDLSCKVKV